MEVLRSSLALAVATGLVAFSSPAVAHVQLSYPAQRYPDQKQGPCGRENGTRTDNVTTLEAGATIDVTWDETVEHGGHFRISFDADGHDDFVDPTNASDTNPTVLENSIPDRVVSDGNRGYTASVTLPDVECDSCTLQLIQVMTTSSTYTSGDLYFQCADLVLTRGTSGGPDAGPGEGTDDAGSDEPGGDAGPDTGGTGEGDASGGCSAAGSSSGLGGALLLALTLLGLGLGRRRRVSA